MPEEAMNYWYIREGAEHHLNDQHVPATRGWAVFVLASEYDEALRHNIELQRIAREAVLETAKIGEALAASIPDAERWRWFRENWPRVNFQTQFDYKARLHICLSLEQHVASCGGFGPSLDEAIDKAMDYYAQVHNQLEEARQK